RTRAAGARHRYRRPHAHRGAGKTANAREVNMEWGFAGVLFVVLAIVVASFRILREYQRAVIFMLGRFWKVKGPGLILVIPGVQQMVRVDLRTIVLDVPTQDVISRDNVSVKVNAVIYFRVVDAQR